MKITIIGDPLKFDTEDSGCARIGHVEGELTVNDMEYGCEDEEDGLFVRIQSWDSHRGKGEGHDLTNQLEGKRLRVTIETLDD